jgi:hypothetical protein
MRPSTERNTAETPCPGDCAKPLALDQGSSNSFRGLRALDCSARTCRIPACTEPKEWLTESANGSVASWPCNGPEQVSGGACPDDGKLTKSGNRVVVPALEALAAVGLLGLEGENRDDGGGPQELGSVVIRGRLVRDSDGHPSGGLQSTRNRGPISSTDGLARAHAYRPLAGARGRVAVPNGGGPWLETIPGRHGGLES